MTATSYVFPAAIPRPPSARAPPGAPRLSAAPAARDFTNARRPNLRGEAANVSIDHSMTQSRNHSMTQWSKGSITQSPDDSAPEVAIKEVSRRVIGFEPAPVGEKVVNLIRENNLLELDTLLAQRLRQVDRLTEGHVAVIVAVDQKHGRAPRLDRGKRRRFPSQPRRVGLGFGVVGGKPVADFLVPVV